VATLLKHPARIREIVEAIRAAVPREIPVSAKLRLGWDSIDSIHENAEMAAEGGASWLTIHARTRLQGYAPPIFWKPIGLVRERLGLPIVANGDIWTLEGFRRCRDETGCRHFMLGRGALANPLLPMQIARELKIVSEGQAVETNPSFDWLPPLKRFVELMHLCREKKPGQTVRRLKQWLNIASHYGDFQAFDAIKRAASTEELFAILASSSSKTPDLESTATLEECDLIGIGA
jgi:tRNA-dihydrouridine synthase C